MTTTITTTRELKTPAGHTVPLVWYRAAKSWLGEYYHARDSFEFYKTRSCVSAEKCWQRMLVAVREAERLGVIWRGQRMPTLDEFEVGCGWRVEQLDPGNPFATRMWTPRSCEPMPWEVPAAMAAAREYMEG
jgi:hypothetical protein